MTPRAIRKVRSIPTSIKIPKEKFCWKPEIQGIKSAHEILQHVVEGNHILLHSLKELKSLTPLSDEERQRILAQTATSEQVVDALRTTGQEVAEMILSTPQEKLNDALYSRLLMASIVHLSYHWGQLAYLQTMWGDLQDHS